MRRHLCDVGCEYPKQYSPGSRTISRGISTQGDSGRPRSGDSKNNLDDVHAIQGEQPDDLDVVQVSVASFRSACFRYPVERKWILDLCLMRFTDVVRKLHVDNTIHFLLRPAKAVGLVGSALQGRG